MLGQDFNAGIDANFTMNKWVTWSWNPPPKQIKKNVDWLKRYNIGLTIACVMKDKHANTIMAIGKQIADGPLFITEGLAIWTTLWFVTQHNMQNVVIKSASQ